MAALGMDQPVRVGCSLPTQLRGRLTSSFFRGARPIPQRQIVPAASSRKVVMPTEALFRGGAKSSNKIAYICRDCGYIYEGREAFEGLDKSYRCPVCQAPKRRFSVYTEPVQKGANNTATRKERKAELQAGRGGGGLNPGIVISIGAVFVLGVFLYLNSVY